MNEHDNDEKVADVVEIENVRKSKKLKWWLIGIGATVAVTLVGAAALAVRNTENESE